MGHPRNPYLAVDAIIELEMRNIVLIERLNEPIGYALPGGFVDYGESCEDAVIREVKEETNLVFRIKRQLHTFSNPDRDPRQHIVSVVFVGVGSGELKAGDDAKKAISINISTAFERNLVFDHKRILSRYTLDLL
jgi:8-oxo-dGTP diphosphatase